ncbi:hypothetical protein BC828DRAFT_383787 [Blastocladiella britannica]|nr:hypothetical protein BC828DRAFT_383787 [Blastocladiella britannica]
MLHTEAAHHIPQDRALVPPPAQPHMDRTAGKTMKMHSSLPSLVRSGDYDPEENHVTRPLTLAADKSDARVSPQSKSRPEVSNGRPAGHGFTSQHIVLAPDTAVPRPGAAGTTRPSGDSMRARRHSLFTLGHGHGGPGLRRPNTAIPHRHDDDNNEGGSTTFLNRIKQKVRSIVDLSPFGLHDTAAGIPAAPSSFNEPLPPPAQSSKLRIYTGTWNMAGTLPDSLHPFLPPLPPRVVEPTDVTALLGNSSHVFEHTSFSVSRLGGGDADSEPMRDLYFSDPPNVVPLPADYIARRDGKPHGQELRGSASGGSGYWPWNLHPSAGNNSRRGSLVPPIGTTASSTSTSATNAAGRAGVPDGVEHPFHLIVIGTQECQKSISEAVMFPSKAAWENQLRAAYGPAYEIIATGTLGGMHLCVMVWRACSHLVSRVETTSVATGIGGVVGNKGGIAVGLNFGQVSLLFINVHLTAHQENCHMRNADYLKIETDLRFSTRPMDSVGGFSFSVPTSPTSPAGIRQQHLGSSPASASPPVIISPASALPHLGTRSLASDQFDYTILLGDTNYRIDAAENQDVHALISSGQYVADLLPHDQLMTQKSKGHTMLGYYEAPIAFPPTFKLRIRDDPLPGSGGDSEASGKAAGQTSLAEKSGKWLTRTLTRKRRLSITGSAISRETPTSTLSAPTAAAAASSAVAPTSGGGTSGTESSTLNQLVSIPLGGGTTQEGGPIVEEAALLPEDDEDDRESPMAVARSMTPATATNAHSSTDRPPVVTMMSTVSDRSATNTTTSSTTFKRRRSSIHPLSLHLGVGGREKNSGPPPPVLLRAYNPQRIPAWTDRILVKSRLAVPLVTADTGHPNHCPTSIAMPVYTSVPLQRGSDHAPVVAVVDIDFDWSDPRPMPPLPVAEPLFGGLLAVGGGNSGDRGLGSRYLQSRTQLASTSLTRKSVAGGMDECGGDTGGLSPSTTTTPRSRWTIWRAGSERNMAKVSPSGDAVSSQPVSLDQSSKDHVASLPTSAAPSSDVLTRPASDQGQIPAVDSDSIDSFSIPVPVPHTTTVPPSTAAAPHSPSVSAVVVMNHDGPRSSPRPRSASSSAAFRATAIDARVSAARPPRDVRSPNRSLTLPRVESGAVVHPGTKSGPLRGRLTSQESSISMVDMPKHRRRKLSKGRNDKCTIM